MRRLIPLFLAAAIVGPLMAQATPPAPTSPAPSGATEQTDQAPMKKPMKKKKKEMKKKKGMEDKTGTNTTPGTTTP